MLVQLGVDCLTPLECARSVAQPTHQAVDRLRRTVIETCKQCGRNRLMRIQPAVALNQLWQADWPLQSSEAAAPPSPAGAPTLRLFAHPYSSEQQLWSALQSLSTGAAASAAQVVIGPEGGLTAEECAGLIRGGWRQVVLGGAILRIETAAVMVASVWAALQANRQATDERRGSGST